MKKQCIDIVVLSSGNGSNLQEIIGKLHDDEKVNINIKAVISDKSSFSLIRAQNAKITSIFFPKKRQQSTIQYDQSLKGLINLFAPQYIILAGFMRILSKEFVQSYKNIILNLHPSLLPKYKGLNTHERVLQSKDKVHGITIHFVNEFLDEGEIIAQKQLTIDSNDTVESLEKRVKVLEHAIFPEIIKKICT